MVNAAQSLHVRFKSYMHVSCMHSDGFLHQIHGLLCCRVGEGRVQYFEGVEAGYFFFSQLRPWPLRTPIGTVDDINPALLILNYGMSGLFLIMGNAVYIINRNR